MRECVGGGAFAELIVGTLFGFDPVYGSDLQLRAPGTDRGFDGTLISIPFQGKLLDISSDSSGVRAHVHK